MPKRKVTSPPTTPSKKTKGARDHYGLDRYFGQQPSDGPSVSAKDHTKGKLALGSPNVRSPAKATTSARQQSPVTGPLPVPASEHDDETLAWQLAKQDGLDLETLKRIEKESASHRLALSPPTSLKQVEIIDVDLLSDEDGDRDQEGHVSSHETTAEVIYSRADADGLASVSSKVTHTVAGAVASSLSSRCTPGLAYGTLATDPVFYNLDQTLPPGVPIPYSFLAHALATLAGTRSRIMIINTLTNTLRSIIGGHPPSLLPALYLLSNSLSPPYTPIELGLGPSTITKAIQHVSGLTPAALRRLYNKTGDPGDVAFEAKSNVRTLIPHPPLLITGVYASLLKIAHAKGQGAANQKQGVVEKLLVAAKGEEIRFLVRTLSQNLRVGAVRTSLLTALSRAMVLTPPPDLSVPLPSDSMFHISTEQLARISPLPTQPKKKVVDPARDQLTAVYLAAEGIVKKAYVQHPNYDHIVAALLEAGLDGLPRHLPLTVGIPLLPTLGSPTRSWDEIYDRLGLLAFTAEFKYDGQRAQIHARKSGDMRISVKIFSRHLEDMTEKYPDIVSLVEDTFGASEQLESFIMDAEIVAINTVDGSIRSFQELSNRARKDVRIDEVKVAVCVFAFDLMYLDGEILLEKSFRERRSLLRSRFPPRRTDCGDAAQFDHVRSCESEDGREAVEEFWQTALNSSCEGLMIKLLDHGEVLEEVDQKEKTRRKPLPATYEPDKRTSAWLKLKKDYVMGLGDSLDLVPIGAWHGNGRKAQWWSPILLAVWDSDAGKLVAVCKCMSGFSDAFYKDLTNRYSENSETCSPHPVWALECETGGLRPEVYFKPQEVWEIRGADVTLSPVSVAALGLVSQKRGLSLRFPRFIKAREDKSVHDASTPQFLADMWRNQQTTNKDQTSAGADDGDLLDVVDLVDDAVEDEEDE